MANALDEHLTAYLGGNLYDFDNDILLNWYPQRVLRLAGGARSVLELGLGHGHSTGIFSRHFDRHLVLEGSPAVIRHFHAQQPDSRAQVVETLFEEFSSHERFDVVVMGFVLEHVDDPQQILRRYREFLTPGGRIFVTVPNAEALNRRLGHLAGVLDDMAALSPNDLLLGHRRFYSVASLRAEIERAGFAIGRLEGIYLKPFTTCQMVSLQLERKFIDALCRIGQDYPELCCSLFAEISAR